MGDGLMDAEFVVEKLMEQAVGRKHQLLVYEMIWGGGSNSRVAVALISAHYFRCSSQGCNGHTRKCAAHVFAHVV